MIPRPGAAKGVVPKNGIGIAFWIAGVPGSADMVKVEVPSAIAAGISRRGISAAAEQRMRHRGEHEESDEQADAAIGDDGAGRARRPASRGCAPSRSVMKLAIAVHRAAVVHQLAEQRAEQEQRKELRQELRRAAHEGLRPVRQQRLARERGGNERGGRREQQHAPAAVGEPDQQRRDATRMPRRPIASALRRAARRDRGSSGCPRSVRVRRREIRLRAPCAPRRAAWQKKSHSALSFEECAELGHHVASRCGGCACCAQRAPSLSPGSATCRSSAIMRSSFSSDGVERHFVQAVEDVGRGARRARALDRVDLHENRVLRLHSRTSGVIVGLPE